MSKIDVKKLKQMNDKISDAVGEMIACLEEDRFYPSVREAGTCPTESACKNVECVIIKLLKEICLSGVTAEDIGREPTFEDVVIYINSIQNKNMADDLEYLKEIDCFTRDNGENKYRYINKVYQWKGTNRFVLVETQRGVGEWSDEILSVNAKETVKKEIIKYEWQ